MSRTSLLVMALVVAFGTAQASGLTYLTYLVIDGVALLSVVVWMAHRTPARPNYSRLAVRSINCLPMKRLG